MSQFDSLIIGEVAQDTNVDYDGTTVHAVGGAVYYSGFAAANTGHKTAVLPKADTAQVDLAAAFAPAPNVTVYPLHSRTSFVTKNVYHTPDRERRTAELLERFRLTELQDRDGRLMSGGQMRRASLAIGIALDPGILLLDEPTANLDIATRREILTVLEDMKDVIQTAVIATHDMQLVCQWAERIIVLCGGRVVADGPRDEIFARADVVEQVGIRPPEIFSMAQALDRRALCYTVEEFLSSFQEA